MNFCPNKQLWECKYFLQYLAVLLIKNSKKFVTKSSFFAALIFLRLCSEPQNILILFYVISPIVHSQWKADCNGIYIILWGNIIKMQKKFTGFKMSSNIWVSVTSHQTAETSLAVADGQVVGQVALRVLISSWT